VGGGEKELRSIGQGPAGVLCVDRAFIVSLYDVRGDWNLTCRKQKCFHSHLSPTSHKALKTGFLLLLLLLIILYWYLLSFTFPV
jgi:hypothetical protein